MRELMVKKFIQIFHLILLNLTLLNSPASAAIIDTIPISLTGAHGLFVTSERDVWLADTFRSLGTSQSLVYSLSGQTLPIFPMIGAGGIAKHPTRDLYSFCDTHGSRVYWVNSKGELVKQFNIPGPWNARWSPTGEIMFVVSAQGNVYKIKSNEEVEVSLVGLDAPFDLSIISNSQLWISEQGRGRPGRICRYRVSENDQTLQTLEEEICHDKNFALEIPEGMWPLADGGVLAVDTGAGRLVRIHPSGSTELLESGLGIPIMVQLISPKEWLVYANNPQGGANLILGSL